jgi:adenosylhomocysteine nucleosidase
MAIKTRLLIACALPEELGTEPLPGDIPVVWTGVGKVNTAIAVTRAIARHQPDVVLNFGTAGRVSAHVSGLVEVSRVIQRDMLAEPLAPRGHTPFDTTPPALLSTANTGVTCASGDSFVSEHDPWLVDQGVDIVEMELFALAMACHQHGVGWQAMKYITDDADSAAAQDWSSQVRQGRLLFRQWLAQRLGVSA